MTTGIWVLGDQLSLQQAALQNRAENRQDTPIIFIESLNYAKQRPYHSQKLVLVWSAMRHFAEELRTEGWSIDYKIAEDFQTPLKEWIDSNNISDLLIMTPSDRTFANFINNLKLNCTINFIDNNLFLWSVKDFKNWAESRKRLLMEDFYRQGRKDFNILMDGDRPIGDKWNFDKENRKPPKKNLDTPAKLSFEPDKITQEVIEKVAALDIPKYGEIEPFNWGVTRQEALEVLDYFIGESLANFGTYQDAMVIGEETMWHSLISPYLNLGLLQPQEVIEKAAKAKEKNKELPLNSLEGFIRQVMGWREYMHGIYHYVDADYAKKNWFEHTQSLPKFYWDSSKTDLNCLQQTLSQVEKTGYAHHIQRLMLLSNFALIIGTSPQELENWFHSAFIDAYDWVMQTNVIGMGQFADGGILASKPYASSANYINKMSDYCKKCKYKHTKRTGENACPFNYFYWDFLTRHRDKLKSLGRMNLILANLKKIDPEELEEMQKLAQQWREKN
ncbi:MAG: cryptochrome/photolyase family protein [Prochloraceae cyanobacterium]